MISGICCDWALIIRLVLRYMISEICCDWALMIRLVLRYMISEICSVYIIYVLMELRKRLDLEYVRVAQSEYLSDTIEVHIFKHWVHYSLLQIRGKHPRKV